MLVDVRLHMRQQHVFVAQKAKHVLGCIKRNAAGRVREVIMPISWNPPVSNSNSQLKKDMDLLEQVKRRAVSRIRGLEHLFHEDRVRELVLFSLESRRLQRDFIAAFQDLKGAYKKAGEISKGCLREQETEAKQNRWNALFLVNFFSKFKAT